MVVGKIDLTQVDKMTAESSDFQTEDASYGPQQEEGEVVDIT